ncbi:class I SAM-dependent methyltransferase [Undibacterium sp. Ji50W]|uniref:class I SAM-dependent methyltransferase n=1 Tax=Undibacterium sp. Ji50W TaxID=3413041 RepID=UPI003BF19433
MKTANQNLTTLKVERSQRYFNKVSLFFYDFILYGVISKYAWGSSIQRLDAHYKKYVSSNHLEVGVGTGFLLNRVVFDSTKPRLALMDLSPECLAKTKFKVSRYAPETYIQNLLEPVQHKMAKFDSIAINYVMHCVPGSFKEKGIAFSHLQPLLSEYGVLFGTSVLSEDVHKNLFAKPFMWLMNYLGVFNNRNDNARDLKDFLEKNFQVLDFKVVGVTAFFAVKNK